MPPANCWSTNRPAPVATAAGQQRPRSAADPGRAARPAERADPVRPLIAAAARAPDTGAPGRRSVVSEPSLPDDPARWPDDPYELLGVPRDVSPRDLRRAYTRLIRAYKPEHFPEQFRRIRAAYETVLRLAEFFGAEGAASRERQRPEAA